MKRRLKVWARLYRMWRAFPHLAPFTAAQLAELKAGIPEAKSFRRNRRNRRSGLVKGVGS